MEFDDFVKTVMDRGGTVSGKPAVWKSVNVNLNSNGTSFSFGDKVKIESFNLVDYGGLNYIKVDDNSKLSGMVKIGKNCKLIVGKYFSCTGGLKMHLSEGANVLIGDDCMFGVDINIYNHDYHPIFDMKNGVRLNYSKDVSIENHVWIANKVTILKGVKIGKGSVIGLGSIVSSDISDNSLAVGSPAKVVRTGIVWDRSSLNTNLPNGIDNIKDI